MAASARAAAAAAAATETAADVATEGAPESPRSGGGSSSASKGCGECSGESAAELRALDAVALATSAAAAATEAAKMAEAAAADPVAKHAAFAATASATTAVKAAAKASELEKVAPARLAQAKAAAAAKLVLERTLAPLHLDPPLVTHPVSILSHRFAALMPCVGVGVTLEMNLGWPSLVMRAAALGTRPCDGIWRTEVDVEWLVQVTIEQDDVWEVIGPSSQLVRLPITSIDSTAAMCQLKWKLVALRVATCYSLSFHSCCTTRIRRNPKSRDLASSQKQRQLGRKVTALKGSPLPLPLMRPIALPCSYISCHRRRICRMTRCWLQTRPRLPEVRTSPSFVCVSRPFSFLLCGRTLRSLLPSISE